MLVDKPAGLSACLAVLLTADNVITRLSAGTSSRSTSRRCLAGHGSIWTAARGEDVSSPSEPIKTIHGPDGLQSLRGDCNRPPPAEAGLIDIPLGTTRVKRPMTVVDKDNGKPSQTRYTCAGRYLGYLIRFEHDGSLTNCESMPVRLTV